MADKFNDKGSKARRGEDGEGAEPAHNWTRKPASTVSLSTQGGGKGADQRGRKLLPVFSTLKLAPVREPIAPADRAARGDRDQTSAEAPPNRRPDARHDDEDGFEHVTRDRNVLSYGIAWTAFAVMITGIISFTGSIGSDPTAVPGPGPLVSGLLSIALGWVVVIAARAIGKDWWWLMVLPALVLIVGPYVYKSYWVGNMENGARSYLSNNGTGVQIDLDATSIVSETVNTSRGCFAITRMRGSFDTEIQVVTYGLETARQQADYALAPRFAGRVQAGGERATARVFTFKHGRAPAIVTAPTSPPLDCTHSTSAPGAGAKNVDQG